MISDIHANLTAFETVLADAEGQWDACWCLGDVIGYGPDPNACVERLQTVETVTLTGNHDWAALGKLDTSNFNPAAQKAAAWTAATLSPANHAWLAAKPPTAVHESFILAHGSPLKPVWEYILSTAIAQANFAAFTQPFCLVGHTHYPVIFSEEGGRVRLREADYERPVRLNAQTRMILNPGSVGQPRNSDPRAAYALLDTEAMTWTFKRVAYDVAAVQERMRAADLPAMLISRLAVGA